VIPADRWHEPYMPMEEVRAELQRMRFYGYVRDGKVLGVIGKERVRDVTLLRHLYVRMDAQGKGIGENLVAFVQKKIDTEWLLIGTWGSARWAVDFYLKRDFALMPDKDGLLRNYWDIPDRQVETSVVLGKRMHPAHDLP
jgi:N-acetylglutamate synthase-like GNAT family acetyltransferase